MTRPMNGGDSEFEIEMLRVREDVLRPHDAGIERDDRAPSRAEQPAPTSFGDRLEP